MTIPTIKRRAKVEDVDGTEEWRPIPSWPGFFASNIGNIKSPDTQSTFLRSCDYKPQTKRFYGRILGGTVTNKGYISMKVKINGKSFRSQAHVLIAEAFHGAKPKGYLVDHINGVRTDNRIENLRYVTPSQNRMNNHGLCVKFFSEGHWHAQITVKGKSLWLGSHPTKEAAIAVVRKTKAGYLNNAGIGIVS